MIDLAALFQEAETQHKEQSFPAFPISENPNTEKQVSDNKSISGNSDISGTVKRVNEPNPIFSIQARASAGASAREMHAQKCRKCRNCRKR